MQYLPWQVVGYFKPVYGKTLGVQIWVWMLPRDTIGITHEYGYIVEWAHHRRDGKPVILWIDVRLRKRQQN